MTPGRRVAVVGVGYSDVGRNTGKSERWHAAKAAVRALDDAGLTAADIDGVSTWGGDAIDFGWMLGMMPLAWELNAGVSPAFAAPEAQKAAPDSTSSFPAAKPISRYNNPSFVPADRATDQ